MVAHVSYFISSLLDGNPMFGIHSAKAVLYEFNISAPSSIEAEYLVFTISTLLWVISVLVASNNVPRNLRSKLCYFITTAASIILFGPGAVVTTLWTLNEDARRSTIVGI
jgi:hypothetical protein